MKERDREWEKRRDKIKNTEEKWWYKGIERKKKTKKRKEDKVTYEKLKIRMGKGRRISEERQQTLGIDLKENWNKWRCQWRNAEEK